MLKNDSRRADRAHGQPLCPKGERAREFIEVRGGKLLYLPPYSPDLNSIEEAFSKIKALLRNAGARTREALVEAIGPALSALTLGTLKASSGTAASTTQLDYCETRWKLASFGVYLSLEQKDSEQRRS